MPYEKENAGMELRLPVEYATGYRSLSQRTRVVTEAWAEKHAFCVACRSGELSRTRNNTPAIDFTCRRCGASYQLKATSRPVRRKIVDAGYKAMLRAIRTDGLPHFLVLTYDDDLVRDLLLIPGFAFSASAIEPRRPLSSGARRAGWVGCNILIHLIPPEGRIAVVESGRQVPPSVVRAKFKTIRELSSVPPASRGWTLDVLAGLRNLRKQLFTLKEAYGLEADLARLHPQNRNIRPKIRQQLQILRDLSHLRFVERGLYEFTDNV